MKKAIIVLNNKFDININFDNYDVYCADGGANYLYEIKKIPKLIVGDMDSIKKEILKYYIEKNVKIEKYPKDKDITDGELIIKKIYNKYEEIIVLGAIGGKNSHFLTNLYLLEKYPKIKYFNNNEEVFIIEKNCILKNYQNKEISFIPIDKMIKLTLKGFKYNLNNKDVERGSSLLVSNIGILNELEIKFEKGKMICIINDFI
ncbi:thiamine diphosphokinase [Hypnocyclicus thermotrophus]|uniref:Thiamine diphosphokinase n=1 Tax=Hypnocyclicus thermotrophus TaxID=1627895 RepID=A0AA46I620_9FUSO|nr:thiamine diphosphokinase [Hypnocyclicus thermotrophus]TDT71937.1 thiamine diphosphokinase [Hypnocyclicus thermotrophus]